MNWVQLHYKMEVIGNFIGIGILALIVLAFIFGFILSIIDNWKRERKMRRKAKERDRQKPRP